MNVLSLFDGISCAYQSLIKAHIPIQQYYASEIEKNAISISTKNHSNIIQLGDVREIKKDNLPSMVANGVNPCPSRNELSAQFSTRF